MHLAAHGCDVDERTVKGTPGRVMPKWEMVMAYTPETVGRHTTRYVPSSLSRIRARTCDQRGSCQDRQRGGQTSYVGRRLRGQKNRRGHRRHEASEQRPLGWLGSAVL